MKNFTLLRQNASSRTQLTRYAAYPFLLATLLLTGNAHALVTAAPTLASLTVATGGTVTTTASPPPTSGTGDRVALANLCSTLNIGVAPGVSAANPCAPIGLLGTTNVGAALNSTLPQTYLASFTPAQLTTLVTGLAAAGQPLGARKFYIVTQFAASPVGAPSVTSFVTVQVNLIEPLLAGITNAAVSFGNVSLTTPTPIYIRYTLAGKDTPLAGQFCSALAVGVAMPITGVSTINPCAQGNIIGLAHPAINFGASLQTGESLIVPETLARQAAQRAQAGGSGIFYFVRQFSSGKFAVVKLQLNGNTANGALAFTDIRLGFQDGSTLQNIGFFKRDQLLPNVTAALRYQGAGMLRARWEIVQPSDITPTALDLTSEASLTPLERAQQHRYQLLDRVSVYLPATGQIKLDGPNPKLLPNTQSGEYLLLLRIEAGDSLSGSPSGIAPFVLPVLRYYIGGSNGPTLKPQTGRPETITLIAPLAGAALETKTPLNFQWDEVKNTALYRLEIETNSKPFYTARVRAKSGINSYTAPPFITMGLVNKPSRWRVITLNGDGQFLSVSEWREINNTATDEH